MAATPIDLDHLARYTGGDKALNSEILRLFNGQLGNMVGELLTVLQQRDARKWRQVTHTIKGAARGVALLPSAKPRRQRAVSTPAPPQDRAITIETLRVEGEAVQAFIERYLAA